MQNIVIIGGGGAGTLIARALSQQLRDTTKYSILLIEPREYYIHYPGSLRMLVSPDGNLEDKVLMSYDHLFVGGNGKIINATASSIQIDKDGGGKITTDDGKEYRYTILVVTSGSIFEGLLDFPKSKENTLQHIQTWRERFKTSTSIAIIGGGPVGCELAGEIRDVYPEKKIAIVQDQAHLLGSVYPEKYRVDVEKRWLQRNIQLILNDRVDEIPVHNSNFITTVQGKQIDADLTIYTRGGRPNTSVLSSLGQGVMSAAGRVKVESTLQVKGFQNIFAAGDIIEWEEVKQVAKYPAHSDTVVANIKNILEGKPATAVYKSMFEVIALTNGSGGGAVYMGVLWGLCFGNIFARMIKAKDLFITKTLQGLGIP